MTKEIKTVPRPKKISRIAAAPGWNDMCLDMPSLHKGGLPNIISFPQSKSHLSSL